MTAPKAPPPLSEANKRELGAIRKMPYGLRGFRRFAKLLVLEDGSRFKVEKFQGFMLGLFFAGIIELVIILAKKNGKTTLLAALALYHLLMIVSAECVIGAASRDQATILFNQAAGLVVRSGLEAVFDIKSGYRVIRHELGRIRVMAADAATADGVIPTLALVDELHRHPSGDLYGVFRDGLGPRHGQMITISTPGASLDSPLGKLRTAAQEFAVEVLKKRRTYTSPDGNFALIEWGLEPGDDPNDMRLVQQANPAPWQTPQELRRRHDSPSMTPGQWARFGAGMWTEGDEPAITPEEWDGLKGDVGHVEPGEAVWMAAHVGETAWIAIVAPREDGVACKVVSIGEDRSGVLTEVELVKLADVYDVREVAHPRTTFMRSAQILESDHGLPMVETPYSPARFAVISSTFKRLLDSKLLMHDGDPALRAQVMAATSKDTETGWRYVLSPRSAALITLANACHQATNFAPEPVIVLPGMA